MQIHSIRGMHDLFGLDSLLYQNIVNAGQTIASRYCFETIYTPIAEFVELFERNLGTDSDIMTKEIYRFQDRSDKWLALRPEFTASVARAFVQHNMKNTVLPKKLFSFGQLFRYDRPQAGRYRQFNQLNFEIIGIKNPHIDVECILMGVDLLKLCGINNFEINLNFLGNKETCSNYNKILKDYFEGYKNQLSEDSQKKLITNPLRILDSKDKMDIKIIDGCPLLSICYSDSDRIYFDNILNIMTRMGIKFVRNNKLVRGLDYYTGIVFEFVANNNLAVLGGGRYDNLIEQISGNKVSLPAIGFASGIERLMLYYDKENIVKKEKFGIIFYSENEIDYAIDIARILRDKNKTVDVIYHNGNIGKKIGKADQLGCTSVMICGPEEKETQTVKRKDLTTGKESVCNLWQI